ERSASTTPAPTAARRILALSPSTQRLRASRPRASPPPPSFPPAAQRGDESPRNGLGRLLRIHRRPAQIVGQFALAAAPQKGRQHRQQILGRQGSHPLGQVSDALGPQRRLDLRQGAQGQAQRALHPCQHRSRLAANSIAHQTSPNVICPALARLMAKLASPSCSPAYSSAVTRN